LNGAGAHDNITKRINTTNAIIFFIL